MDPRVKPGDDKKGRTRWSALFHHLYSRFVHQGKKDGMSFDTLSG